MSSKKGIGLSLNEYQLAACKTNTYPSGHLGFAAMIAGLAEEAGEVAGKFKKNIRDAGGEMTDEFIAKLLPELGDTLWYLSQVAERAGLSLAEVGNANLEKLADRKNRGVIGGDGDNR